MVTQEQAIEAAKDLATLYLRNEPWIQYVHGLVPVELEKVWSDCPTNERADYCVWVWLTEPLPRPHSIVLRHNGIRVTTQVRPQMKAFAAA